MKNSSSVAVFIDVENIHYSSWNRYSDTPDWSLIVDLCKEYGRISSIQAFGDWVRFQKEVPDLQKNGIQPVFVPLSRNEKSSLDCYLTVSAMKLFFQNRSMDTLILASGDRDYIPLIAELKALGKKVYILAVPETLSKDLTVIVDGVISYEPKIEKFNGAEFPQSAVGEISDFVIGILKDLEESSEHDRWVNLSTIGVALKKSDPSFTHTKYGYNKLAEMLDAIPQIELKYDSYEKTIALARTCDEKQSEIKNITCYGEVLSINEGYGFIKPDEGQENIFFHHSKLQNIAFIDLQVGNRVSYSTYNTERGVNAERIHRIEQTV